MLDLKPYYDAVVEAEAEVQYIAAEIDAKFREETEEGQAEALELRPALEDAQSKLEDAKKFYESMQNATRPNDVIKNFIPVSDTDADPDEGSQPTVIKRQEYDKLSLMDRANFIRSGGKIED